MCKVGGPRCDGSHTPSARQRAKRKANKAYRRALADTIEQKTGDADLAKRVRQANMTDLHEVAVIAGINEADVAHRCGTASYTTPDGETVTVDVAAPGQTRRTDADADSKQLFEDVFAATTQRSERHDGNLRQKAVLNGDRERIEEIDAEVNETREWIHDTYADRGAVMDLSDEELVELAANSSRHLNTTASLAGDDALSPQDRMEAGGAAEELARRGLKRNGTPYTFDNSKALEPLPEKDDENPEYAKARRLSEQFNRGEGLATDEDYIRNRAMFEELARRCADDEAREKYYEMAQRMDQRAAVNSSDLRFNDMEVSALCVEGWVNAAVTEGRSDEAMHDLYNEVSWHREGNPGDFEDMVLAEAQRTAGAYLDKYGITNDEFARNEMETDRRLSLRNDPQQLSDSELRDAMEHMTNARGDAYRRSDNPEVRAEADALAAPLAAEYARRVENMDDLSNVPAYMWPENTDGKTLPSEDELINNAEFYYGLRDVSRTERRALADDSDNTGPVLAGMAPDGAAVYRDAGALYRLGQPRLQDIPDEKYRREYNDMRLYQARSLAAAGTVDMSDTSDAEAFVRAKNTYDTLGEVDNGRLGGAPARAAQAKQFLDTHPVVDGQKFTDDDMHLLADRARAATAAEEHVRGSEGTGVDGNMIQTYAAYKASQERARFAKALDDQLRRGGTYGGFVDEHGMSYEQAFKVVEDYETKGVRGGDMFNRMGVDNVKREFEAAAREGREPKYAAIAKSMKPSATAQESYESARKIVANIDRTLGSEDYPSPDDGFFTHHERTAESWNRSAPSGSIDDIITRDGLAPAYRATWKSKADADVAASYVQHYAAPRIVAAMHDDVDPVRSDGTYLEARVAPNAVDENVVRDFISDLETDTLDSFEYGDSALRGVTRNAAGKIDPRVAEKNYAAVYAYAVSSIGADHEDAREEHDDDEGADYEDSTRRRAAYVTRLRELYDQVEHGNDAAAAELLATAAAGYSRDESFLVTRQYVDPDQESLF